MQGLFEGKGPLDLEPDPDTEPKYMMFEDQWTRDSHGLNVPISMF